MKPKAIRDEERRQEEEYSCPDIDEEDMIHEEEEEGVTRDQANMMLAAMNTDRDQIVRALSIHKEEILEANEWRPLADHVVGLMARAFLYRRRRSND